MYRFPVVPASNFRPLILCFILFFFASLRVMAQRDNPMFFKEVQLEPKKKYTLQSLTRTIQQQTGISFSYNAARISPSTKIRMKNDRITVEQILASIRKKTGIGYKIISKSHIIYTEAGIKKRYKIKGRNKKTETEARHNSDMESLELTSVGRDSVVGQQIVIVGDSSVAAYYFSGGVSSGGGYGGDNEMKYPVLLDVTEDEEVSEYYDKPGRNLDRNTNNGNGMGRAEVTRYFKNNTLLALGISADEIYYLNPTARAGFDFLYGTISYNLGPYAQWRYGIGASVKVNDNWRMHLNINTGQAISEQYNIQKFDTIPVVQPDTIIPPEIVETNTPLRVQSKLTRVTLSAEWDLGRGFALGAGLTLNSLKTNYSSNGNPVTLSNLLPIGYDADQKYRTIKPPYVLGNTYSGNQTSNVKTWIGLQLTLIYRLSFFE